MRTLVNAYPRPESQCVPCSESLLTLFWKYFDFECAVDTFNIDFHNLLWLSIIILLYAAMGGEVHVLMNFPSHYCIGRVCSK